MSEVLPTEKGESQEVVKEISVDELRKMLDDGSSMQLIDVREAFEREAASIGGECIPFEEMMKGVAKISKHKQVVLYCEVGLRSHILIQRLQVKFGFKNLYNLKGGIQSFSSLDPLHLE